MRGQAEEVVTMTEGLCFIEKGKLEQVYGAGPLGKSDKK